MSERDDTAPGDPHQVFLDLLEGAGFFTQIANLEQSLGAIADELKAFGSAAQSRADETENLAAHVLAIESVLAAMLKAYPVEPDALLTEVQERTAALAGNAEGSPTVRALALDILAKAKA